MRPVNTTKLLVYFDIGRKMVRLLQRGEERAGDDPRVLEVEGSAILRSVEELERQSRTKGRI